MPRFAVILCLLMCFSSPAKADEQSGHVQMLLSGGESIYQEVVQGLSASLGSEISQETYRPKGWQVAVHGNVVANPNTVVVAIGSRALSTVIESGYQGPLLSLLVPSVSFQALVADSDLLSGRVSNGTFSAIYMDQPAARQLALARLIKPDLKSVGALYDLPSEPLVKELRNAANREGIEFRVQLLDDNSNPLSILRDMYRKIDVFLPIPGQFTFNRSTAKWMLFLSLKNKKPLLGFSSDYVKAGALAGVFSSAEDIGKEGGAMLNDYFSLDEFSSGPRYPDHYSVVVNREVASRLRIKLPDEQILLSHLKALDRD